MNMNHSDKFTSKTFHEIYAYGRPASSRPRMSLQDRAKIFSPFAALRGHRDAVEDMQHVRCDKILLTEAELQPINECLQKLKKHDRIMVTYFVYDPGPDGSGGEAEGEYHRVTGTVFQIEPAYKRLHISVEADSQKKLDLPFEDILYIQTIVSQPDIF